VNVRPHSGQVNSAVVVADCLLVAVLLVAPRFDARGCVLSLGTSWPPGSLKSHGQRRA